MLAALAEAADGPAQGQGTMNNLTLAGGEGGGEFTYYETIGGGQGACATAPGPSAVHVAMSNTLNTPVEALETELPVRVRRARGAPRQRRRRAGIAAATGSSARSRRSSRCGFTLITERRDRAPRGRDGRRRRRARPQLLNGEPLPAKCAGRASARRRAADRDAGRRRLGPRHEHSGLSAAQSD